MRKIKDFYYFLKENKMLSFALMVIIAIVAGLTWSMQPCWVRYCIAGSLVALAFCRW